MVKKKFKWDKDCTVRIPVESVPALSSIKEGMIKVLQVQFNGYTNIFGRNDKSYPNGAGDRLKIQMNLETRCIELTDPEKKGTKHIVPFEHVQSIVVEE
jgi:hypothetical protein